MWTCSTSSCKLLMLASLAGFSEDLGAVIATPGVAEKGYIDMNVVVNGKGGHSSVPPPHTVLSEIFLSANPFTDLQNIEHWYFIRSSRALRRPSSSSPFSQCTWSKTNNHWYSIAIYQPTNGPIFETIECLAAHAPELPSKVRQAVKLAKKSSRALRAVEAYFFRSASFKSLVATTQAIDLICEVINSLSSRPTLIFIFRSRRCQDERTSGISVSRRQPPNRFRFFHKGGSKAKHQFAETDRGKVQSLFHGMGRRDIGFLVGIWPSFRKCLPFTTRTGTDHTNKRSPIPAVKRYHQNNL